MNTESDRELLEWAAKAAKVKNFVYQGSGYHYCDSGRGIWNPLINEGDRYRLAKDLRGNLYFSGRRGCFEVLSDSDEPSIIEFFTVGDDKEEAYAIVKAAAKIGRNMG